MGAVEKVPKEHFEIATRFFESLALTRKRCFVSLRGAWRRSNHTFFNSPHRREFFLNG